MNNPPTNQNGEYCRKTQEPIECYPSNVRLPKVVLLTVLTAIAFTTLSTNAQNSQNNKTVNESEEQADFLKMRKTEFTKLISGPQDGVAVTYSSEKTALEGSGNFSFTRKHEHMLQIKGSIGTTTNLSNLFDQKTLPIFSASVTYHFLLSGKPSLWFYAGDYATLKADPGVKAGTSDYRFAYPEATIEKIEKGKATDKIYTLKGFTWVSLEGKYENAKYTFYDPSQTFDQQISNPHYTPFKVKGSLSTYWYWNKAELDWRTYRPNFIYANVSLQYGQGNNIDRIKKTTVNDISSSQVSSTTVRQTGKSQSAYTGIFQEYKTFRPAIETVISPVRSIAINLFGDYNGIRKADRNKYGIGNDFSYAAGAYMYGKINIGVYYKWTRDIDKKETQGIIGLKTSIPIAPVR